MLIHNNKQFLTIEELCDYLPEKPEKPTVYNWTRYNKIPFRKFGVKLYFDKELIDKWDEEGRPATALD